jgi:rod shape-determining protein MreC
MREKGIVLWVVLGAVLLIVLNLPDTVSRQTKGVVREGVAPIQGALSTFSRGFSESIRFLRGLGNLMTENQKISAEVVLLRNQVRDLKALEQENVELRKALGFSRRPLRSLIPCEVISRDITGWWQTIRMGRGTADNVVPNMAVVTLDGLIGKTVDASPRTCDVLLISDPQCKVSARIERTGSFGILKGTGQSGSGQVVCQMEFINKNVPIMPGDEVVTSGLGGVFPRGLLIGYVEKVYADDSGLFQRADVIPKADLGVLTYVFVVAEESSAIEDYLRKKDVGSEL